MAPQLAPAVRTLREAFGLEVAWRDPLAPQWDVENAMLPVGESFLQVCAPLRDGSGAARFLAKHPAGGACIVALECGDLARRRARLAGLGIRVVAELCVPGYQAMQLHPRDSGACMLEFNATEGGGAPQGPYGAAGPHWQRAVRCEVVHGLAAIEVRARAPQRLAAHWGQIAEAPVGRDARGLPELSLGPRVRFGVAGDDEPEGVAAIELACGDPCGAQARALHAGLPRGATDSSVRLLGLEVRLVGG
jgi:hypothetical protein